MQTYPLFPLPSSIFACAGRPPGRSAGTKAVAGCTLLRQQCQELEVYSDFLPAQIHLEQFRRLVNVYFLAMGFLMLLGTYTTIFQTPLTAFSTLFPLTIVLGISMIQEAATDINRHRSDDETNNRLAKVTSWQSGVAVTSETVCWRDIRVGNFLYISNKQPLPADMVILASIEEENICYIETSSIDGETNLKLRRAISYLPTDAPPMADPAEIIARLEADQPTVKCELPMGVLNPSAVLSTFPSMRPKRPSIPPHCKRTSSTRSSPLKLRTCSCAALYYGTLPGLFVSSFILARTPSCRYMKSEHC